jgi:hypothetical protein
MNSTVGTVPFILVYCMWFLLIHLLAVLSLLLSSECFALHDCGAAFHILTPGKLVNRG